MLFIKPIYAAVVSIKIPAQVAEQIDSILRNFDTHKASPEISIWENYKKYWDKYKNSTPLSMRDNNPVLWKPEERTRTFVQCVCNCFDLALQSTDAEIEVHESCEHTHGHVTFIVTAQTKVAIKKLHQTFIEIIKKSFMTDIEGWKLLKTEQQQMDEIIQGWCE